MSALMEQPSSALRYGLLSVKPIPYEEIVKVKGFKYRATGVKFEHDQKTQFEKFEDFISFRYGQVFETMPIPAKFSREQVTQRFINEDTKRAKKDKEFMEHIERKEGSLLSYVSFIKDRYDKEVPDYFQAEACRFVSSNLPLSLFAQTSMYINTYQKYLTLVKRIVRRFEVLSNLRGVRRRFEETEHQLSLMKKELSPLIDKMDLCSNASLSLKLYILIWSAETIKEIVRPKFLDINKLDKPYLQEYTLAYNMELKSMRRMLYDASQRFEPTLFQRDVTANPQSLMLSKLLTSGSVCRV